MPAVNSAVPLSRRRRSAGPRRCKAGSGQIRRHVPWRGQVPATARKRDRLSIGRGALYYRPGAPSFGPSEECGMFKRFAIPAAAFVLLAALPAAGSAAHNRPDSRHSLKLRDGQHVDVRGTVEHLEQKVSHKGNSYVHVLTLLKSMHSRVWLWISEPQRRADDYGARNVRSREARQQLHILTGTPSTA